MLKAPTSFALKGIIHLNNWQVEQQPVAMLLDNDINCGMHMTYSTHGVYNSIAYLGSVEQYAKGWDVCPTPPHGSRGKNFRFILRAHAYAIDPAVAKSLIAHVIQQGIYTSLDTMLRADLFPIHQMGLFAYDLAGETTIKNRPIEGERSMIKNDDLSI